MAIGHLAIESHRSAGERSEASSQSGIGPKESRIVSQDAVQRSVSGTISVPALNLAAGFAFLEDELLAEIREVCTSGQYVLGEKVAAFERDLAAYCGVPFALGVSSGTDALLMALMALEVGPGDEIIVPAFTFFATAGVVHRVGARPVFVDIDPGTLGLDVDGVRQRLTPKTRAVIPVHLYGRAIALRSLCEAVEPRGVAIVEDAAQAIGAVFPDDPRRHVGAAGLFGAISFYPTKNLGALGDAGALLTHDEALFEKARKLRVHGSGHTYYYDYVGGNFRIDALQAAVLRIKLRYLDAWNARRRQLAARYTRLLDEAGLVPEHVRPTAWGDDTTPNGPVHVYHQYVVRARRRDALLEHLRSRGIGAAVYYPLPLHLQKCFAHLGYGRGDFPHAEQAAKEVLALPIYPELTEQQQDAVVEAICDFYR